MASAWYINQHNGRLRSKISQAMNYWFDNDYDSEDCVERAGKDDGNCPCETPGLWNTNWFDQAIAMPKLIGNTCLLLKKANLTSFEIKKCTIILQRSYGTIDHMSGANMLDVASNSMMLGLFTDQPDLVTEALGHAYSVVKITGGKDDGIRSDGSFMQHRNQLYTGNYGKDYINNLIDFFVQVHDTPLAPANEVQNAFQTLMDGTEWMVISNSPNKSLLWEYSTIGRMISFAVHDMQASDGVAINLTQIAEGTSSWHNASFFKKIVQRLTAKGMKNANQGPLKGTRYFYASDYMVHRGSNFVVTLKMFSERTTNAECVNNQNPFGFHLSDGAIYTYMRGDEYVDVFGAWDWNLVPGTTVDYAGTPLLCEKTRWVGKEDFVGGTAYDHFGIAVMNYQNPYTRSLKWKKTVVFFPDGYAVQIDSIQSKNASALIRTTLDQSRFYEPFYLNSKRKEKSEIVTHKVKRLWHNNVGYYFPDTAHITVDTRWRKSDWESIGVSKGDDEQQLFTATIQHQQTKGTSYIAYMDADPLTFPDNSNASTIQFIGASKNVRGAYYKDHMRSVWSFAFWAPDTYTSPELSIESNQAVTILLYSTHTSGKWTLAVADPTQKLAKVRIRITVSNTKSKLFNIDFPKGNLAGSTVRTDFSFVRFRFSQ
ncbi:hypothetical protein EC973_001206 [Apophysomyces ossiformis]|uniref:Uncharacterized protein n=1 Tax=Apophysomyces ossiformis TaxID=679940 RepID=A0A8H7BPD1_9FUNG|nr:hypothetical protein EC973_001206 [Apophysomyces ossiformis]